MKDGISVVICCYNSASRLPETLVHLAQQQVPSRISWEVILIDNNSTDDTVDTALSSWKGLNSPVTLLVHKEEKQGLSAARTAGLKLATYAYVIFCDDDNWLNSDYVWLAYNTMYDKPEIGILGGCGKPVFEVTPPQWILEFLSCYAVGPQESSNKDSNQNEKTFLYGAGFVIRKRVWLELNKNGFESIVSDRLGDSLMSGGDNEICYLFYIAGYKLHYIESLSFKHFLPKNRLTWKYLKRLYAGFGASLCLIRPYQYYLQNNSKQIFEYKYRERVWLRDIIYISINYLPKSIFAVIFSFLGKSKKKSQLQLILRLSQIFAYFKLNSQLNRNIQKVYFLASKYKS